MEQLMSNNPFAKLSKVFQEQARDRALHEDKIFKEATQHVYDCRCAVCLDWWAKMGPDPAVEAPDGGLGFGPFTEGEINAYCIKNGLKRPWVK
jgi:hypothetical protein